VIDLGIELMDIERLGRNIDRAIRTINGGGSGGGGIAGNTLSLGAARAIAMEVGPRLVETAQSFIDTPGPPGAPWPSMSPDTPPSRKNIFRRGASTDDNMLIDMGEMVNDIHVTEPQLDGVGGCVFQFGYDGKSVDDGYAGLHDTGTNDMPARPILLPAVDQVNEELLGETGGVVEVAAMTHLNTLLWGF
jgi:hypothetical protein